MSKKEKIAYRKVEFDRVFNAPRELVFKAWTESKRLAQWWGPKEFTNPVCEVDARPGGLLRVVMRSPHGTEHPMTARFHDIVKPERLVFTTQAVDANENPLLDGLVIATFENHRGKTRMIMQTTAVGLAPIAGQMLAGMQAGWSQSLDRLAQLMKKH